jgi:hypothetical protein
MGRFLASSSAVSLSVPVSPAVSVDPGPSDMDILLVDLALALALLGLVSFVRPLRFLKVRTRRMALLVFGLGVVLLIVGLSLPVVPPRLPGPRMAIDDIVPSYQFGEHHEILVAAPPDRVLAAARAVTTREIRLFRLLTWLRSPRFSDSGSESILNPGADRPILDVALRSGFVLLREQQDRELVFGAVVCCGVRLPPRSAEEFRALSGSLARAVMNFHVEDIGGGASRLVTQTRVATTDPPSQRAFARYWRIIYPGSALIRIMWLRAIKTRAEAPAPAPVRP